MNERNDSSLDAFLHLYKCLCPYVTVLVFILRFTVYLSYDSDKDCQSVHHHELWSLVETTECINV